MVTAANVPDRDGSMQLLENMCHKLWRLRLIWADQAYAGELLTWVRELLRCRKLRLAIVKRAEGTKGFQILSERSIVERMFGWLGRYRLLTRDD